MEDGVYKPVHEDTEISAYEMLLDKARQQKHNGFLTELTEAERHGNITREQLVYILSQAQYNRF